MFTPEDERDKMKKNNSSLPNIVENSWSYATATRSAIIGYCSVFGILVILYTVLVIYLGIFSYGNPDPVHCYYIDGLDTTGLSKAAVSTLAIERNIPVRTGYPIDVAHLFRSWFLWGFWGSIF